MKISFLTLLAILLLFSMPVAFPLGGCTYQAADGSAVSCDYNSDAFYQSADYNNPNINWDQFDQSKVPAGRVAEIPTDKVEVAAVSDKSQLTQEQLNHGDNLNKLQNWRELNQQNLGQALSQRSGRNVRIDGAAGGQVQGNTFSLTQVDSLQLDESSVTGGTNVRWDGINLAADFANSILTGGSASTNVRQFSGFRGRFSVDSADSISSGCVRILDITNAEFNVGDAIQIVNLDGEEFAIVDCSYSNYKFSGPGSVTIEKRPGGTFYLENGKLEREGDTYNEAVETEQQATIETDAAHGFTSHFPV